MPRKVEITLPSHQTDELIPEIKQLKGMISLRLQRNASIHPPGDVIENQGLKPRPSRTAFQGAC